MQKLMKMACLLPFFGSIAFLRKKLCVGEVPPSNRLEKLHRDRKHQHSIRINDQYRIAFTWVDGNAKDVEILDYH